MRLAWPEIADFNDGVMKRVLVGEPLSLRDQELDVARSGPPRNRLHEPRLFSGAGRGRSSGRVVAIVVETTARVRAERWLHGERERLRQMFAQAPGFMAMLSGKDHIFELANAAYLQLIGYRHVLGKSVREALPELAGQRHFMDEVYAKNRTFSADGFQVELQRPPGAVLQTRFVDLVYQPLRGADGEVIGIFVQGSDVTDRVAAETARPLG